MATQVLILKMLLAEEYVKQEQREEAAQVYNELLETYSVS